jgi:hypothetical protein
VVVALKRSRCPHALFTCFSDAIGWHCSCTLGFCIQFSACCTLQIGMHFMNPPVTMDLLEVIGGKGTSDEVRYCLVV